MPRTTAGCRSVPRHRARACTAPREHPRRPLHAPRWCPAPERSSECSCCCCSAGGTAKSRLHESWTCQRTVEPTACYWSPQLAAPAHQLALDVRVPTTQRTSSCTREKGDARGSKIRRAALAEFSTPRPTPPLEAIFTRDSGESARLRRCSRLDDTL